MTESAADAAAAANAAALARYRTRLRRSRIRYVSVIAVVAVAMSVITAVVWLSGEISHTTLHTIGRAPAAVELGEPTATQQRAWSTTDHPAVGTPYSGGTVVTFDTHTVRGRNALTGAQTWYYTRTDRTVCTAIQDQGVTVAVYRLNGNCDEVTALATETGKREWTRTLDEDTHQLNGTPTFAMGGNSVLFYTPSTVYAVDINSGYDDWLFSESAEPGTNSNATCVVHKVVLGSAGALISQTCAHRACSGVKFCLNGPQLILRNATQGENTDSSSNNGNPDQIIWAIANPSGLVPASAGSVVSVFNAAGTALDVLNAGSGKSSTVLNLSEPTGNVAAALQSSTDQSTSDAELIWFDGMNYAVTATNPKILWRQPSAAPATTTTVGSPIVPTLSSSRIAIATSVGVSQLDPQTGSVQASFALSPVPGLTARIYPFGAGFVTASGSVSVFT